MNHALAGQQASLGDKELSRSYLHNLDWEFHKLVHLVDTKSLEKIDFAGKFTPGIKN